MFLSLILDRPVSTITMFFGRLRFTSSAVTLLTILVLSGLSIGQQRSMVAASQPVGVSTPLNQYEMPATSFSVSVFTQDTTGLGIISYDCNIFFDPSVVQLQATPVGTTGTLSSGGVITPNEITPGHLIISFFRATPLTGSGILFNLQFTGVGAQGSSSPLTWGNFAYNEGSPSATFTGGTIHLDLAPTAAHVTVAGKVVSADHLPISGAIVKMIGRDGSVFSTRTNQFGSFRMTELTAGQTYVMNVFAKGYEFSARAMQMLDDRSDLMIVASP
jgi:hypothetical protein